MQYHFGTYCFDPARYTLTQAGRSVPLRPMGCELLAYLLTHRDRVVPKEELLAQVWPGQYVGDAVLHACILAVRRALHDTGRTPAMLHTVRGRGYRFVAPVEVRDLALACSSVAPSTVSEVPATPVAGAAPHPAGEYKPVSLLCCGLPDAPVLATRLGSEGLYHLLQTVVELVQEVLQPYDGTLLPPTSASVTAVFGAPVAQEDHARRAVLAALALHQRLRADAALAVRMGVHSGLVVVGELGQAPQPCFTVVGDPVHMALRLQQRAASGTILLSAATYHLVHAEVRVIPCGTLAVDDYPTSLPIYTVQGLVGRHAGVAGRGRRHPSPFVGRTRELARLHDHLAAAIAGQGQVVGLVGEPGLGKTRLVAEFCRRVPGDQATVYMGQCLSYGQRLPYLPVRALVQQVCGLVEGDPVAVHTAAVQQRLHASGITAEDDVALLLQLLHLPVAPEALEQRSPEGRQARTFALLRHLILDAAQQRPLVLVVENLHWSDPTSAAWLASLVERLAEAAVLLLVTYRPGYQPAWGAHTVVTQIAIPPLRTQESRTVVQAMLGAEALPEARLRALVAQAEGNPFFLEELAWHAREQGAPDTPEAVPATVHAVLAARLDRLSSEAKHLLQVAAVIGPEVPLPLVQALAELSEEVLHRGLAELQAAEFLYETRLVPDHVYTFKHALTHEVAYSSLLQAQRRILHARIVEAIEGLAGGRVAEVASGAKGSWPSSRREDPAGRQDGLLAGRQDPDQLERLAHHALLGEVWDKALTYGRQAGEKAMERSAYDEAVGYLEQALSALSHLPEQRDIYVQAIDLRLTLRHALFPSGDLGRILTCLREAESLAATLGDTRRLGHVSLLLSSHFWHIGTYGQAIAAAQRARAAATAGGEGVLHALANHYLGRVSHAQGEYQQAIAYLEQTVASLDGARHHEHFGLPFLPAVLSHAWLAACHAERGTFAAGRALGEAGLRIAEAVAHPLSLMFADRGIGLLALRQGDLATALPRLERAVSLCQDAYFQAYCPVVAAALSTAYTLDGRVANAVPLCTQVMGQITATDMLVFEEVLCRLFLGETQVLAGHLEEAHACTERTLALARERQERGHQAYALRLLGDIAARRDPPEVAQAEAYYCQALTLADAHGMRPLQAHCYRSLGTLYARRDQAARARTALANAIDLYHSMEMTLWLPQAEATLAQGSCCSFALYGFIPAVQTQSD
jgi:DNA-binding winged helix-turn-helix (wHTH) protein/tetratricopeptide (TPR) repeat protein